MQSRGSWSPLSGISGTTSSDGWWHVEPGTGNVRMSLCYKERACLLITMRRVGRSFVPVIFLTNHCAPGDAFFFKWIFPGEAVRKIHLKTGGNAAGRGTMIYLWWKGKTGLYIFYRKQRKNKISSITYNQGLCKFRHRILHLLVTALYLELYTFAW